MGEVIKSVNYDESGMLSIQMHARRITISISNRLFPKFFLGSIVNKNSARARVGSEELLSNKLSFIPKETDLMRGVFLYPVLYKQSPLL